MAHRQQPTPSTDSGPNTTAPTSMQSSVDDESAQVKWEVDPMDQPDDMNTNEEADGDMDTMPETLTFVHSLMRSNEGYMARVERLLSKQEQLVEELNAKELTILKLKTALEREKDARAKLEERVRRMLEDQAAGKNDAGEEKAFQSPLEDGGLGQREAPPAVSDHVKNGDSTARLEHETFRREQSKANLIEVNSENPMVAEEDYLDSESMIAQDDEDFRELPAVPTRSFVQDSNNDLMPFRKKRKAETMTNGLYNLQTVIARHFPTYVFRPLIRSLDQSAEYGHLEDLHPAVHKSLQTSLQTFHARIQRPQYSNHARTPVSTLVCCGYLWMTGCTSSRAWTVDSPGKYTCKTCFNNRRACFLRSHGEWVILPLPPSVRDVGVTYRDRGFYIYGEGGVTAKSFPDVWEEGMKAAKARERREIQAASEAGWSEVEEVPGWMVY